MKIKVDLKIFIIVFMYILLKKFDILALSFIFILIHELGHVLSGITLGLKIKKINMNLFGFSLEYENYGKKRILNKIIIDLAGPFVNLILFLIGIIYKIPIIAYINLCILIVNMLPISPLDGGRVTKNILLLNNSYKETIKITRKVSAVSLIITSILLSMATIYFRNIAFIIFLLYLWYLNLKESKKNAVVQKVFKMIDNNI